MSESDQTLATPAGQKLRGIKLRTLSPEEMAKLILADRLMEDGLYLAAADRIGEVAGRMNSHTICDRLAAWQKECLQKSGMSMKEPTEQELRQRGLHEALRCRSLNRRAKRPQEDADQGGGKPVPLKMAAGPS